MGNVMITQLWDNKEAVEMGIPHSDNSIFFRWQKDGKSVYFSMVQKGDALECHVCSDRKSVKMIETAINQMCQFCFMIFFHVNKIVSHADKRSFKKIVRKCGFGLIATIDCEQADNKEIEILMRFRNG